jgi:hypothetical protein
VVPRPTRCMYNCSLLQCAPFFIYLFFYSLFVNISMIEIYYPLVFMGYKMHYFCLCSMVVFFFLTCPRKGRGRGDSNL